MTPDASSLLSALLPLIAQLSSHLPEPERYRRLLAALRTVLPGDAAARLRFEENGTWLRPLAIDGLSPDTLGRRFRVVEGDGFDQYRTHLGWRSRTNLEGD